VVETIRLESGHTLTGIGGSNPSLSAIYLRPECELLESDLPSAIREQLLHHPLATSTLLAAGSTQGQ
jgi:hypothetical protein